MHKLISILVPAYNAEKYIGRCLDSLVNQTYENIEIIVIDDGSTDNTNIILEDYSSKHKNIKVFHQSNHGLAYTRNRCIDYASGSYILFVDSDDYIHLDMCSILYSNLKNNDADISCCSFVKFYEEKLTNDSVSKAYLTAKENIAKIEVKNECRLVDKYYVLEKMALDYRWVIAVCKLYKKELFENFRYPEGLIHEDESIYKLYYKCNRIVYIEDALYYYMLNTAGITFGEFNEKRLDVFGILKERMVFYKSNNEQMLYKITIGEILAMYERYYQNALQRKAVTNVTMRIKQECNEFWEQYADNKIAYIWKYPKVYQMLCPIATPFCIGIRSIKKISKKIRRTALIN